MQNSSKSLFSQSLSDVKSKHWLIRYLALLFIDCFPPWNKIKRSYQWLCCGWNSKHFDGYLNLLVLWELSLWSEQNCHQSSIMSHITAAESPCLISQTAFRNIQLYEGLSQTEIFNKVCHGPWFTIQMAHIDPFIFPTQVIHWHTL